MPVLEGATSTNLAEVGAAAAAPLHISGKPIPSSVVKGSFGLNSRDFGQSVGHYRAKGTSGIIPAAFASGNRIVCFRNHGTTVPIRAVIMKKLLFHADVSTTFFTAGSVPFIVALYRSVDNTTPTGGTAWAASFANDGKMRTSMEMSTVMASSNSNLFISPTTTISVPTVLDTNALAVLMGPRPSAGSPMIIPPRTVFWEPDQAQGEHPLLLLPGESLSIRTENLAPIAGTWTFGVEAVWTEIPISGLPNDLADVW